MGYSGSSSELNIALLAHWSSHAVVKQLREGGLLGKEMELVLDLEDVLELGDLVELEPDSEFELESAVRLEMELELETVVSLVAPAPIHLLLDPGGAELEISELHADCLGGFDGARRLQKILSEVQDLAWIS